MPISPLNIDALNELIKSNGIDTNKISDGYHTFEELYEHRIVLFIALCREMDDVGKGAIWKSKKHSDGSEWEGWFIMGIYQTPGAQITYHLPMSKWADCEFAYELPKAPEFDGHTSADVLERLKNL